MRSGVIVDKILGEWKQRITAPAGPNSVLIPRELDLPGGLRPELATILTGPRRAGKSTLLGQLPSRLGLPLASCWFCNFEDPNLALGLGPELLDAIRDHGRQETHTDLVYFFFDEIQEVPHWEKWLHKAMVGARGCVFVLTGSNASMLSGALATALTGRFRSYELFPFSWTEFKAVSPDSTFADHLERGGFPVALTDADPGGYLKELFRNIVLRDIAPRVRSRSTTALLQVVASVFQSAGSELSLRRIAGAVGVSVDTVGQYLEACEQAYLLFACPYFTHSARQSAHRNRKYYPVDTALGLAVSGTIGRDRGKSLETFVFLSLRRRGLPVHYWRDEGEVDFVVRTPGGAIHPIQVSWDGPTERHLRALECFYERHPHARNEIFVDAASAAHFASTVEGLLTA